MYLFILQKFQRCGIMNGSVVIIFLILAFRLQSKRITYVMQAMKK